MTTSPLTTVYDHWTHPSYERRVRLTPTYLWGSHGITQNIAFDKPLILHIRNGTFGQPVTIAITQVGAATPTSYGTLQPAECISIPMQDLSGVYATCATESVVACVIAS
jgi:hypothetical protein